MPYNSAAPNNLYNKLINCQVSLAKVRELRTGIAHDRKSDRRHSHLSSDPGIIRIIDTFANRNANNFDIRYTNIVARTDEDASPIS